MELTLLFHFLVWPCDCALASQHVASLNQSSEGTWLKLGQIRVNWALPLELLGKTLSPSLEVAKLVNHHCYHLRGEAAWGVQPSQKKAQLRDEDQILMLLLVPLEPTMPETDVHWNLHKPINSFSAAANLKWAQVTHSQKDSLTALALPILLPSTQWVREQMFGEWMCESTCGNK